MSDLRTARRDRLNGMDYNYRVRKFIFFIAALAALASACGLNPASSKTATPTLLFITATLPPTTPPAPTQTAQPATASPAPAPLEGTTSARVNVRDQPSATGAALGMIDAFAKVQIVGKDAGGAWYQIIFAQTPNGKGWIAAQYVDAKNKDAIPVIGGAPTPAPETASAAPTNIPPGATSTLAAAPQDNDSQQAPAVNVIFSPAGARSIIYSSSVSAPVGDAEDWIQFTPYDTNISASLTCAGNGALITELWQNNAPLKNWGELSCGESKTLNLQAGQSYLLRLRARSISGALETTHYSIAINAAP